VRSHTSIDIFGMEGQVPEIKVKGETVDISTMTEYAWYEWVKFQYTAAKFPVSKIQLGRYLSATVDIGPAVAQRILKNNGQVMYRTSVRSLTPDEIQIPSERKEREELNAPIGKKYGFPMNEADFKYDPDYADLLTPTYDCYEDDEVPASKMPDIDDVNNKGDIDNYDHYVGVQVRIPIGDEICTVKVVRRNHELDGTVKGRANDNSMLDTRTYEIEFPDGHSDEYTSNFIADNMYVQCDAEGRQNNLM
jgi:hypothetical protein